jgi:hypothetical protein
LLSAATEPIRAKVPALPLHDVSRETITEHVERMALAVLAPDGTRTAGAKARTTTASQTKSRRRS